MLTPAPPLSHTLHPAPVISPPPPSRSAYFNRGSTHDSIGQYDRAIADYTRALDLDRQLGGGTLPEGAARGLAASPRR